ncbi:MAG: tetratricopeptide repeat protein [Planctomycetota bacterium]|nr:tetratricopeptide repeat protein [Planctomycetota bacterium]
MLSSLLAPALLSLVPTIPDSWAPPSKVVAASADGAWSVTITPGKCTACGPHHTGEHNGTHATAKLSGPKVEREFELQYALMPVTAALTGEGDLYCFDHWGQLGHGKCLVRYGADGNVRWSRTLEQVLTADQLKQVPQSISSRAWLRSETRVEESSDAVVVSLWNGDRLHLDRDTGASRYEEVTDHADDVWGWYLRSMDLQRQGKLDLALEPLDRAVDLELDRVDGYLQLAYLMALRGTQEDRAALLRYAIARTSGREAPEAGSDPRRNLHYQLATALIELEKSEEAREILEELLDASPIMDSAAAALVSMEFRAGNTARAEQWIRKSYDAHLAAAKDERRGLVDATMTAAYLCQQAGEDLRAGAWYQRALDRGLWDENLVMAYLSLLDGRLDRPRDASRVMGKLLARWRDLRSATQDPEHRAWWDERIADFEQRQKALDVRAKRQR